MSVTAGVLNIEMGICVHIVCLLYCLAMLFQLRLSGSGSERLSGMSCKY